MSLVFVDVQDAFPVGCASQACPAHAIHGAFVLKTHHSEKTYEKKDLFSPRSMEKISMEKANAPHWRTTNREKLDPQGIW